MGTWTRDSRCLHLFGLRVNAKARKVGSGHWVDAAGIDPAAGRRQTGQGRDNIVPYLFSQMSQGGNSYELRARVGC